MFPSICPLVVIVCSFDGTSVMLSVTPGISVLPDLNVRLVDHRHNADILA